MRSLDPTPPFKPTTITFTALLPLLAVVTLMGGCAGNAGKPIVDMKGVNAYQYEDDLAECSEYADQVPVAEKAATGAVTGAAVGAAVGVIWDGYRGNSPERGAATGAVLGGAGGAGSGVTERNRVVKNCLRGRGYSVLN